MRRFVELAAVASLVAMVLVVTLQVFARFLLPSAPAWTEELSRILFIYSVAFGIGVAVDREELVRLALLDQYLSPGYRRLMSRTTQLLVIGISVAIALYSLRFVAIGHEEYSPVLGIRMSVAFAGSLIVMVVAAFFTTFKMISPKEGDSEG